MSVNVSELIEKAIASVDNDIPKVLRNVAIACKKYGFFNQSNWDKKVMAIFNGIYETTVENSFQDEIDASFESSFVPNSANSKITSGFCKFKKLPNKILVEAEEDMFDERLSRPVSVNSNDSFEIPETQADPPKTTCEDDLTSEEFVTIPDDDIEPDQNVSKSPDLLCGLSLFGSQLNVTNNDFLGEQTNKQTSKNANGPSTNANLNSLDDNDSVDMDMSKLEWNDVRYGSIIKSASVTPELDFDLLPSTKNSIMNLDRDPSSTLNKTDLNALLQGEGNTSSTNKVTKSAGIDCESPKKLIAGGEVNGSVQYTDPDEMIATQLFAEQILPLRAATKLSIPKPDEAEMEETQIFTKSTSSPKVNGSVQYQDPDAMEATQLFVKQKVPLPVAPMVSLPKADEAEMEQTQIFAKPISSSKKIPKIINSIEYEDPDAMKATQLFVKQIVPAPDAAKLSIREADEAEMEQTQIFAKRTSSSKEIPKVNGYIENQDPDAMEATQLFVKQIVPLSVATKLSIPRKDEAEMEQTQIFAQPTSSSKEIPKVNGSFEYPDPDAMEATQLFVKQIVPLSIATKLSIPRTDEAEMEQTQVFAKPTSSSKLPPKDESEVTQLLVKDNPSGNSSDADNIYEIATQKIEVKKPRKRNPIIGSSDEEDTDDDNLRTPLSISTPSLFRKSSLKKSKLESSFAEVNIEGEIKKARDVQAFGESLSSKKYTFLDNLNGADWSRYCAEINEHQSKVQYISIFDQCKDTIAVAPTDSTAPVHTVEKRLKSVYTLNESEEIQVNSSSVANIAMDVGDARKSSRSNSTKEMNPSVVIKRPRRNASSYASLPQSSAIAVSLSSSATSNAYAYGKRLKPNDVSKTYSPAAVVHLVKPTSQRTDDENENIATKASRDDKEAPEVTGTRSSKRKAVIKVPPLTNEVKNSSSLIPSTSNRILSRSRNSNFRVLFTIIDSEPYKSILQELNIKLATDDSYDVLITDKIYRSTKFMCALATGKPIVNVSWLNASKGSKKILDPFDFLLHDKVGENKYNFCLAKTLQEAMKNGGLFKNYSILVTPNTSPGPDILKDVISSSGAKYLKTSLVPRKDDKIVCISDRFDKKMWPQLKNKYKTLDDFIEVEGFMRAIFQYNFNANKWKIKNV